MSDMIIQKEDELNKKLLVYFRNAPKWPDWILNEKSHKKDKEQRQRERGNQSKKSSEPVRSLFPVPMDEVD